MSQKFTIRTGLVAVTAAAALAAVPGSAGAAFDSGHAAQCQNADSILGVGASFQRDAQLAWGATLLAPNPGGPNATGFGYASTAGGGCAAFKRAADGGTKSVSYEPKGSGDGRAAFGAIASGTTGSGVRNTKYAFGGADEPPTTPQLSAANGGPTSATSDDAVLHTIPVASSAVATDVRLPDGCAVADTARQITRQALAGAFSGSTSYDTWGEVLPSITGSGCAAKQFKRVVRFDSSGTTFAFKRYLSAIDPSSFPPATATSPSTLGNTAWPAPVLKPTTNGAGAQLDLLNAQSTDGGIGYSDVATSRDAAFDWAGSTDTSFWVNVQSGSDTSANYPSPALNSTAGTTNKGANCANVTYGDTFSGGLPATTDSWYNVDATRTSTGYPLCALTYALAWEQASQANVGVASGVPPITQDQARAVKDYLGYDINANGGQALLPAAGYSKLPSSVLSVSQAGVGALNY